MTGKRNAYIRTKIFFHLVALVVSAGLFLVGCSAENLLSQEMSGENAGASSATRENIPAYSGNAYVILEDNQPSFPEGEDTKQSFETYAELDGLGRCGTAYANISRELMPTEERGNISPIKPSGWQTTKYDCVEGKYLYNRCHLIGFQLSGENANRKNLITGTRYLNVEGMLPFENQVAEYVKTTGNHVLYRVTPVYEGENLVADGVQMEARSVEDNGAGICFNIYAYNVQPGIVIDYATGKSCLSGEAETEKKSTKDTDGDKKSQDKRLQQYVLNTNTKRFHVPSCSSVSETREENKENYEGSRRDLLEQGYEPCGRCKP